MRALFLLIVLGAFAAPAQAQSLPQSREVIGHAGYLGEWELTATVAGSRTSEYSGPLTMTHVGMCTQDGPEQKTGEMRFQISGWTSRMNATLLIDGVVCTYSARLSDAYTGMMNCPDKRAVPLTVWVK